MPDSKTYRISREQADRYWRAVIEAAALEGADRTALQQVASLLEDCGEPHVMCLALKETTG